MTALCPGRKKTDEKILLVNRNIARKAPNESRQYAAEFRPQKDRLCLRQKCDGRTEGLKSLINII